MNRLADGTEIHLERGVPFFGPHKIIFSIWPTQLSGGHLELPCGAVLPFENDHDYKGGFVRKGDQKIYSLPGTCIYRHHGEEDWE